MALRKRRKTRVVKKRGTGRVRRKRTISKGRFALRSRRRKRARKRRIGSLVSANQYNRFFHPPCRTIRLKVDRNIWNRIAAELPPVYRAPDLDFVHQMKQFLSASPG